MKKSQWVGAAAIFLAAPLLFAGCGKKSPVLLQDSIDRITKSETNVEVLKSWVMTGANADVLIHIDTSDDMRVFPPSYAETMKNSADHLKRKNVAVLDQIASLVENGGTINLGYGAGLYKRVIWVLPATVPVGGSPVETFKKILYQKRPYTKADLEDLAADGTYVQGSIDGVPVTVTRLEDLQIGPEETAIVDIDLAFFLGLKSQDPDGRMGTRVLLDVLRVLKRKQIAASQVSINLASVGGAVPYDIRFFGAVIGEIVSNPGMLDGALPQKYEMMIEAEDALIAGRFDRAVALYNHLTERSPNEAGLFFSRAVVQGFGGDGESAAASLMKAYDIDTSYMMGIFQMARVLAANGRIEAGKAVLELPALKKLVAEEELDYQKGIFYLTAKDYREALVYLELVEQKRSGDFALGTVMYQAYKETGNTTSRITTIEKLLRLDEARVQKDMPWMYQELGLLYEEMNIFGRAREALEKYLQYVPNAPEAEQYRRKIDELKAKGN